MFTADVERFDSRHPFQSVLPSFHGVHPIWTGKAKFRLCEQDYFKNFPGLSSHFLGLKAEAPSPLPRQIYTPFSADRIKTAFRPQMGVLRSTLTTFLPTPRFLTALKPHKNRFETKLLFRALAMVPFGYPRPDNQ